MYQPKEPYGRPAELTHQAIFDKVARHLLSQNSTAIGADGLCDYRTPGNKACAVGCLISDEEMMGIRPRGAWHLASKDFADLAEFYFLLTRLQSIHDHAHPVTWVHRLRDLAHRMSLSEGVLDEAA